jgi:hypothetical protein
MKTLHREHDGSFDLSSSALSLSCHPVLVLQPCRYADYAVRSQHTHWGPYDRQARPCMTSREARARNGPNLFHSFGDFNVPTNNIANFLVFRPCHLQHPRPRHWRNISNIFGTIQTTDSGTPTLSPNPAGFCLGRLRRSTSGDDDLRANYLKLADGVRLRLPLPRLICF